MPVYRRLGFTAAILLAVAALAASLTIDRLWCDTAAYADSQMRPLAVPAGYVPPPGPIYLENDSYYWLSYAQRIGRGEDWRVRDTKMDNFPTGREVHWSQSISWAMVVFGKTRALFTDEPLATAIEKASTAINPLLYALAATVLFVALAGRFGLLPVAIFLAFLGCLGDVGWTFQPLRPGHQGLHVVFGAASVLGLVFGGMGLTVRQAGAHAPWTLFRTPVLPGLPHARRWFTLAGVATGLALWVSATIESFFIYPMLIAFVLLLLLVPADRLEKEGITAAPDLWRWWGWTAGAVGLLFYLVEYFPHRLAMRLEVNHPIYEFAVVGCGEALRILTLWRWSGRPFTTARIATVALWLTLAALPILLIVGGPLVWHHMRDPQMLRLHNFIQEFYTYNNFITTNRFGHFLNLYGVVPFVSLLAPFFLLRRELTTTQVIWLWMPFACASAFMIVAYQQIRWMGFYACAVCLSALTAAHYACGLLPRDPVARNRVITLALVLILLVQPVEFFRRQIVDLQHDLQGIHLENELITPIINKRVAYALKASPSAPKAVIADPGIAPGIEYFSGIPCLTSFYWENTDGLHTATRFFTTTDPEEARRITLETGASHVIVPPGATLPNYFYYIAHGRYDTADAANTFLSKLLAGKAPLWIQPDTVLNPITSNTYSYRGTPVGNRLETFQIQD